LEIDFNNMVKSPFSEAEKIHHWLRLSLTDDYKNYLRKQVKFSKSYKSRHHYKRLTEAEISLLEN
jgi:hypothetical protein